MRKHEKVTSTVTKEVLVETTCDLCGKVAKSGDWQSSTYDEDDTEVTVTVRARQAITGYDYGDVTEQYVDICPECFQNKLIPFLESEGAVIQKREYDY